MEVSIKWTGSSSMVGINDKGQEVKMDWEEGKKGATSGKGSPDRSGSSSSSGRGWRKKEEEDNDGAASSGGSWWDAGGENHSGFFGRRP